MKIFKSKKILSEETHIEHGELLQSKLSDIENDIQFPWQAEKIADIPDGFLLCSLRLNDTHRLLYTIVTLPSDKQIFIAFEPIWNHQYPKSPQLQKRYAAENSPALQFIRQCIAAEEAEAVAAHLAPPITSPQCIQTYFGKPCFLNGEQLDIAARNSGTILLAPAGVGKTLTALEWMTIHAQQSQQMLYVTTSEGLCNDVRRNLNDNPLDDSNGRMRVLSWDELTTLLINNDPAQSTTPADVDYFLQWHNRKPSYKKTTGSPSKNTSPKKNNIKDADKLYVEFTQVIIQPGKDLTSAYLSQEEYKALGIDQSCFAETARDHIYDLFETYLRDLTSDQRFEPHIRGHQLYHSFVNTKNSDNPPALSFDGLVIDEFQRFHIWQLYFIFHLLKNPKNGNWFLTGDAYQSANQQHYRVMQPLYNMLNNEFQVDTKNITCALNKNYRNAQHVAVLANRLLQLENNWFGSREKETTYELQRNSNASMGDIQANIYDQTISDNVKNNAHAVVIIPDSFDLNIAKSTWGENVLHLSSTEGLEWDRVILYGFDDLDQALMQELESQYNANPATQHKIKFARKKNQETPSLAIRNFVLQLYSAVTRAKESVMFIADQTIPTFITELFSSAKEIISPLAITGCNAIPAIAQPVVEHVVLLTPSSPEEWLETVQKYCNTGNLEVLNTARGILCGKEIWSTEEVRKIITTLFSQLEKTASYTQKVRLQLMINLAKQLLLLDASTQSIWLYWIENKKISYDIIHRMITALMNKQSPTELEELLRSLTLEKQRQREMTRQQTRAEMLEKAKDEDQYLIYLDWLCGKEKKNCSTIKSNEGARTYLSSDERINLFTKNINAEPGFPDPALYFHRAISFYLQQKIDQAKQDFEQSIRLNMKKEKKMFADVSMFENRWNISGFLKKEFPNDILSAIVLESISKTHQKVVYAIALQYFHYDQPKIQNDLINNIIQKYGYFNEVTVVEACRDLQFIIMANPNQYVAHCLFLCIIAHKIQGYEKNSNARDSVFILKNNLIFSTRKIIELCEQTPLLLEAPEINKAIPYKMALVRAYFELADSSENNEEKIARLEKILTFKKEVDVTGAYLSLLFIYSERKKESGQTEEARKHIDDKIKTYCNDLRPYLASQDLINSINEKEAVGIWKDTPIEIHGKRILSHYLRNESEAVRQNFTQILLQNKSDVLNQFQQLLKDLLQFLKNFDICSADEVTKITNIMQEFFDAYQQVKKIQNNAPYLFAPRLFSNNRILPLPPPAHANACGLSLDDVYGTNLLGNNPRSEGSLSNVSRR